MCKVSNRTCNCKMLQTEGCYVTENNESKSIKSCEAHKKYLIIMRIEQFSTEY